MGSRLAAALRRSYAHYARLHELRMRGYEISGCNAGRAVAAPRPLRWTGRRLVGDVLPS